MRIYELDADDDADQRRSLKNPLPVVSDDEFTAYFDAYDEMMAKLIPSSKKQNFADYLKKRNKVVASMPVQTVDVSLIVGSEKTLNPDRVKSPSTKPPILLKLKNGKFFVIDGNHRVAHSISKGDNAVKAIVASL